jgi:hypothetical protein
MLTIGFPFMLIIGVFLRGPFLCSILPRYGLEYDLDVYNIVAVNDFNMGAMENKGLNVFNTALTLAKPSTATDADYERIESVVGRLWGLGGLGGLGGWVNSVYYAFLRVLCVSDLRRNASVEPSRSSNTAVRVLLTPPPPPSPHPHPLLRARCRLSPAAAASLRSATSTSTTGAATGSRAGTGSS